MPPAHLRDVDVEAVAPSCYPRGGAQVQTHLGQIFGGLLFL